MESSAVPHALREQLGGEATVGLLELLETTRQSWSHEVVTTCLERFERRLVQEVAGLRGETVGLRGEMLEGHANLRTQIGSLREEIAQTEGKLRLEIAQTEGKLRQDIAQTEGKLRQDIAQTEVKLRQEIGQVQANLMKLMLDGFGTVRQELANNRVEFLRWSFLFWVGQFFAVAGLVGVVMRAALTR